METRLHGPLVKPSVKTGLDQLRYLRYVLQPGPTPNQTADGKVEAVVVKEAEGHHGRSGLGGIRGNKGDTKGPAEAHDAYGESDGKYCGQASRVVEKELGFKGQSNHVTQVNIHPGLQPCPFSHWPGAVGTEPPLAPQCAVEVEPVLVDRDHAAIAKYRKVFAQGEFGNFDLVEEIRAGVGIEGLGK